MTNEEFQKFMIDNMVTKTDLEEIKQSMATKADIEEIRQSLTRIENEHGDKLESLYDAREVSIDQNERIAQSLVRIESNLERLSLKVTSHDATLKRAK